MHAGGQAGVLLHMRVHACVRATGGGIALGLEQDLECRRIEYNRLVPM